MDDFDPELWFHRRASFYVEAQLLYHLNACGVFACLEESGPQGVPALAERLGLVAQPLSAALEYVAGIDPILTVNDQGEYSRSPAGHAVLKRYSRPTESGPQINFFDVRVGAYGPIWEGVGRLLRGESQIGVDLNRKGGEAARGVYTVGAKMAPGLGRILEGLDVAWEMEWGVTTGLLALLAERGKPRRRIGLDRKAQALGDAEKQAGAMSDLSWIQGELWDVKSWGKAVGTQAPGVFFSVHFHEFMSQGEEAVQALLRDLSAHFPGSKVVAIEQPSESAPGDNEVLDLYAQSNRLIHHLIGNGKVLSTQGWTALFEGAGCPVLAIEPLDYLGYKAFVVEL